MSKINQGYTSVLEYLSDNFRLFRSLERDFFPEQVERLEKFGARRNNPKPGPSDQLIGSLQPFADMWKDFKNIFKPYKSKLYVGYDFIQPIYGIGNIIAGVVNVVAAVVVFIGMAAVNFWKTCIVRSTNDYDDFQERMSLKGGLDISAPPRGGFKARTSTDLKIAGTWMLKGVAQVVRGVTQILAYPLTLARMLVRTTISTIVSIWGNPKIEENPGIKKLVAQGHETITHLDQNYERADFYRKDPATTIKELAGVEWDLYRKYNKSVGRWQETGIMDDEVRRKFRATEGAQDAEQKRASALAYLGLFGDKSKKAPEGEVGKLGVYHSR